MHEVPCRVPERGTCLGHGALSPFLSLRRYLPTSLLPPLVLPGRWALPRGDEIPHCCANSREYVGLVTQDRDWKSMRLLLCVRAEDRVTPHSLSLPCLDSPPRTGHCAVHTLGSDPVACFGHGDVRERVS